LTEETGNSGAKGEAQYRHRPSKKGGRSVRGVQAIEALCVPLIGSSNELGHDVGVNLG